MALNIENIVEELKGATILELNDLVKAIEEEFGVSAAAPVAVAAAGGAACGERTKQQPGISAKQYMDVSDKKVFDRCFSDILSHRALLLFCKNVKPEATVTLTGECADEIFAGYPWFFREDALNSGTFPWSIAISERQTLLHPDLSKKVHLKEYIDYRYNESLEDVEILDTDSKETAEKRKISYLTLNWFMQTLLDRSDRMAMYNGFELRVPFCDYRLAQYVWNIPWEMKALNGREKGLLRYICKDFLPAEIVDRKKSPYPKTHNPTYLAKVKDMLTNIMQNPNAPINDLLNRQYILEILDTNGSSFTRPWFGQLMTGPQLMAYLCQVNMWLEKYEPRIEI